MRPRRHAIRTDHAAAFSLVSRSRARDHEGRIEATGGAVSPRGRYRSDDTLFVATGFLTPAMLPPTTMRVLFMPCFCTSANKVAALAGCRRTQPFEARWPSCLTWFVPWIA